MPPPLWRSWRRPPLGRGLNDLLFSMNKLPDSVKLNKKEINFAFPNFNILTRPPLGLRAPHRPLGEGDIVAPLYSCVDNVATR